MIRVVSCRIGLLAGYNSENYMPGCRALGRQRPSVRAFKCRQLGSSSLEVTEPCLGTMTWGVQNSEEEAHEQLDYSVKEKLGRSWFP